MRGATSQAGLHREFETLGFAVDKTGGGGSVLDLETGRHTALGTFSTILGRLEERLGADEVAPAVAERDARERERREAGIVERVERLREEPGLVLDRLAEMRAGWNAADVEREMRSMLGVRDGYDAAVGIATQAITEVSLRLDVDAYTLERVVVEERAVFDAAMTLAERRRDVALRAPAAELDAQEQAAYTYLAGGT